jgi:hypothetical protein
MDKELLSLMAEAFGADTSAIKSALNSHGCDAEALRKAVAIREEVVAPELTTASLRQLNSQLDEEMARLDIGALRTSHSAPRPPPTTSVITSSRKEKKNAYRWVCDICGTENTIRDIVQSSRRASQPTLEDDSLTCKECQFRPRTV